MEQPVTRDKSKKRAAILEGAIDVFIEAGYELASMDRIAETAGVSKKTVYNHFGSKEQLFQAVVSDFLAQRQTRKSIPYRADLPLEEQLIAFAQAEIFLIDTPRRAGLSRFLTTVFLQDLDYMRATVAKYPPNTGVFLEWLRAAQADHKIHSEDPLLAARVFYAMVEGGITYPAIFSNGVDHRAIEPMLREIARTFLARYGVS